jgi:hypothetical protein
MKGIGLSTVGVLAAVALGIAPPALADGDLWSAPAAGGSNLGCETVDWGFLGSQQRTICDGPRQADGSWMRYRVIWTPAGYVPRSTYCGSYSCSSSGGYYRPQTLQAKENYIVFDENVVQGEPGWLPPGTDIIR